jgi:hypothetical protein
MKTWQQMLVEADDFVKFLEKDSFLDVPYQRDAYDTLVTTSVVVARNFALNDSFDDFDEWETVTNSESVFSGDFEWSRVVKTQLRKNAYFGLESKRFNGAIEKWSNSTSCPLIELMLRDIEIIFQCYANGRFPAIWKEILDVYLKNGFPCGWNGRYPEGQIVVFSNET